MTPSLTNKCDDQGARPPTVSMTLEVKRPGRKPYAMDAVTVGIYGVPVNATQAEISEYIDSAHDIVQAAEILLFERMKAAFHKIKGGGDE